MTIRFFGLIFSLLLSGKISIAQEEGISQYYKVKDYIEINYLPSEGTFLTIQVAAIYSEVSYDQDFFSTFVLINPVFIKTTDLTRYSVGIYNSYDKAYAVKSTLDNLFPGAFLVAYKNGERIWLDEFKGGNVVEKQIDLNGALQRMKAIIETTYFRIRTGYYEKEKLERKEKKLYQKLSDNGITFEQEPYENGKIYVTSERFLTVEEAIEMQETIQNITGNEAMIKPYFEWIGIDFWYLKYMYEVLTKNNVDRE